MTASKYLCRWLYGQENQDGGDAKDRRRRQRMAGRDGGQLAEATLVTDW